MAVQKVLVDEFLQLAKVHPVLDVRSPGEYLHAHMPGAHSLPLFTDEERKVVGTAYKQENRKIAIKIGLDYFGVKMRKMVQDVEELLMSLKPVISKKKTATNRCIFTGNTTMYFSALLARRYA